MEMDDDLFTDSDLDDLDDIVDLLNSGGRNNFQANTKGSGRGLSVGTKTSDRPTRIPTASDLPILVPESRPTPPRKRTGYGNAGRKYPNRGSHPSIRVGRDSTGSGKGSGGINDLRAAISKVYGSGVERSIDNRSEGKESGSRNSGRPTNISSNGRRIRRSGSSVANGNIETHAESVVGDFDSAVFTCYVKDLKFNVGGDGILQLVIPYENRHEAAKFIDTCGVMINVSAYRHDYEG